MQTVAPTGRIIVKFEADSGASLASGALQTKSRATGERIEGLLGNIAPGASLTRHIGLAPEMMDKLKQRARSRSAVELPDFDLYARIETSGLDQDGLLKLVRHLVADPAIETAFLEPVAVPAALGFDAITGAVPEAHVAPLETGKGPPLPSGDFVSQQGYLDVAPTGVGALAMADSAGARGATVQVIDVEGAWLWTHEDLPAPLATMGGEIEELSWRNHGTAVLGEIRGTDNGYGVRGIVPDCAVGASSVAEQVTSEAILAAAAVLDPGDIILIELHGPGPRSYEGGGQFGYMPMEFWQDNFDAIMTATAAGIIVVEAAGNGFQNLDDELYAGLFDPAVRYSGAIMSGATGGSSLDPADFSNHGQRVDLNGWGWSVVTCAYGDLQGDPDYPEDQWYTAGFSGTSSASPIVVGAVASLQGMVEAKYGFPLDAQLARYILNSTGTTVNEGHLIGRRPNLVAAWAAASTGIGEVSGTITDAGSGLPLEGIRVDVLQTGGFALTASDGSYRFSLTAGDYDLSMASFYYEEDTASITVYSASTTTCDKALTARPTLDITGTVRYKHLLPTWPPTEPLPGATVEVLGVDGVSDVSDVDGVYTLGGLPAGHTYKVLFHNKPGWGAHVGVINTAGQTGGIVNLHSELAEAGEDFESSDGGFSADSLWAYGTPAAGGPVGGFSGTSCWGIGMTDNYPDSYTCHLTSPTYDLSAQETVFLSFHYWMETETGFDGVNVQVFDGLDWQVITPLSEYTDGFLGGLGNQPGWAGNNAAWRGAVFDVSDWTGGDFTYRLKFGSDSGVNGAGFWIDDMCLWLGGPITGVEMDPPPASPPQLSVSPNPFNPMTTVAWRIPTAGHLRVDVHDLRGRLVRILADEPVSTTSGSLRWNGRDEGDRSVASGVYLVRVQADGGQAVCRRVLLAK